MDHSLNMKKKALVLEDEELATDFSGNIGTIVSYDKEDDEGYVFYKLTFTKKGLYDEWFHESEVQLIND
ncbi:hypothetical protein JOC34_000577 [Virgibacillus halotolerans]|uniref:hypothetical protein n=1 Tax=Virgibacillus halotolerans TaxID=1071053 RepID=UPI001961B9BA|nr:hypothetical protein [Virgibacillus halotolerans]MBM7598220.1 hypothetical protein [Virgibacillus halotolerans]